MYKDRWNLSRERQEHTYSSYIEDADVMATQGAKAPATIK